MVFDGGTSSIIDVTCSVPQGSVLGPLLFILYTAALAVLASQFGVNLHAFADDNQLHVHCDLSNVIASADTLQQCITAIGYWMSANRLKLNADKTELIWAGTRHSLGKLQDGHGPALTLGSDTVDVANAVRILGVTVTPDLALEKHVSMVSAKCFFQLRQLRRVRRSLDSDSITTLVHALVTSRVDYCNCLLANAPATWTDKLQRVLNAAARIITDTRKFDHGLTHILQDQLHWLDIPRRVMYRLCTVVYRCLHGLAPPYLTELCRSTSDVDGRSHLRSAARGMLVTPSYKLSTYGKRAFSYAGPSTWNLLPDRLKDSELTFDGFRRLLKTFYFEQMIHPAH